MSHLRTWPALVASSICGLLLAAGCSSATKHRWLTVFFDGVPGPEQAANSRPLVRPQVQSTNPAPVRVAAPAEPSLVVHAPYAERNCVACHASDYSQRLRDDVSAICMGCHKAFLAKAAYVHAPVADGQCTLCHTAHQAKEKYRLVKESRELCFDCHEPDGLLRLPACGGSTERVCTECHDPHQENRRFLLRSRVEKRSLVQNETPDK